MKNIYGRMLAGKIEFLWFLVMRDRKKLARLYKDGKGLKLSAPKMVAISNRVTGRGLKISRLENRYITLMGM